MSARAVVTSALALGVVVCGCTAPAPEAGPLSDADVAAITQMAEEGIVEILLAKDWAAFGAAFTEDAVRFPPNEPMQQGRATIEEWVTAAWSPMTFLEGSQAVLGVEGRGDLAVAWGTYSFTAEVPGLDEPVVDVGKFLVVVRKQADGSWLVSHSIYNADAPMPMPGASDTN